MNPVPREIEYDYDQMTQDFKSAKKEAPIKPIKVAEGVYKKPVGNMYFAGAAQSHNLDLRFTDRPDRTKTHSSKCARAYAHKNPVGELYFAGAVQFSSGDLRFTDRPAQTPAQMHEAACRKLSHCVGNAAWQNKNP